MVKTLNTADIGFASSFGYLQHVGDTQITVNVPGQSVSSGASVTYSGSVPISQESYITSEIKFSIDSDTQIDQSVMAIADYSLTSWVRMAFISVGNGSATLTVNSRNRTGGSQTLPAFSVVANISLFQAPFVG